MADVSENLPANAADLTDSQLRQMMAEMIAARVFSQRAFNLQRQGRAGTNAPVDGSEGIIIGASHALDPTSDWVLPQYRELVGLQRFGDEVIDRYTLYVMGHPDGGHMPEPIHVWPPQISLATQIPHAVGMAWGQKLRNQPGVSLVFFGDGSSSEGDFYEAGNFAGVLGAPVIFMCVNNGWAISTPTSKQTAAVSFADKAHAFGFPGVQVDGTDALAVLEAVAAARARAVRGDGPTLIEAVTYRLAPHTTADDPTRYVPGDVLDEWRAKDPLLVLRRQLEERRLWSDEDQQRAAQEADDRMELAVQRADATPTPADAFFDHVYAEMTPRMASQRQAFNQYQQSISNSRGRS
jgi:pyruvate dehydrogenase E1 component alpha subunit